LSLVPGRHGFLAPKSGNLERMTAMPQRIRDETKIKMRPELELVLFSARAKSAENQERIRDLLGEGVNWDEVLACAIQHKLLPVLCERLHTPDTGRLAQDQREVWPELARSQGKNSLVLLGEMLRLHGLFEAGKIPAIPYKGPVLAWLAYHDFALRSFTDLDFVVPQRHIPVAVKMLQAAGYNSRFDPGETKASGREPSAGEYAFVWEPHFLRVELHTERTLRYFPRPLNLDEMNARLIPVEIAGRTVRTFSVEDTLVMLCVHGAKHFWERLAWIVDVARLAKAQTVDWPLAMRIAEEMKCVRLLLLGLYLAHDLVGASLPEDILEKAQLDANVRWLAGKVSEQIQGISDPSTGVLPRALFRMRSGDGLGEGVSHLLRLALSPTESDRQIVRLPHVLAPVYMFVRPWRLLREYGVGFRRRLKPDLAIYEPTPAEIVDKMLRLSEISPNDVLYDLGCGDGRIVVMAAEKYGIRAVGVDINPRRIAEAKENARRHGVEKRVQFILGDAKKADLSKATVISMFLGADANLRLADRLRVHLRPGARIVSRDFLIYGWAPERIENHIMSNGVPTSLYLWTIKNAQKEASADEDAVPELRQTHKAEG
jgi:hypothetical protein